MASQSRRDIIQRSALKRIGREWAYVIILGPIVAKLALLVGTVYVLWRLWLAIPHGILAATTGLLGLVIGGAYIAYHCGDAARQRRMSARASARGRSPGFGLGWVTAGVVLALFVASGFALVGTPV